MLGSRPQATGNVLARMCPYAKGCRNKGDCGQRSEPKHKTYIHVRFMTANIGSMAAKCREIADSMHRGKIMIACVQETKWKGSKGNEIGEGFKLY